MWNALVVLLVGLVLMIPAIIVTFRAPEKLAACVKSLEGQAHPHVIDNSPPAENLLYTAAINRGLYEFAFNGEDSPDAILVCCDDVIVSPGCVDELVYYMTINPKCAIAMPIQVARSGEVTCGGCTAAFPFGRHVNEPLTHDLYKKPFESFWANGACFALRLSGNAASLTKI